MFVLAVPAGAAFGLAAAKAPEPSHQASNMSESGSVSDNSKVDGSASGANDQTKADVGNVGNSSSTSISSRSSSSAGANSTITSKTSVNSSGSHAEVTVNGQKVDLPENGSVHKTITNGGTKTDVDINVSGNSSNSSNSSVNLNVSSNSSSNQ